MDIPPRAPGAGQTRIEGMDLLVCQLGTTRSISTLLQRVGRAEHRRGGLPKGRLFPLTRDELVECVAAVRQPRPRDGANALARPEKARHASESRSVTADGVRRKISEP